MTEGCDREKLIEELRKEVCFWKLQYNLCQKNELVTNEKCSTESSDDKEYKDLPRLERISSPSDPEYDDMPDLEPIAYDEEVYECGSEQGSSISAGGTCSTCSNSIILHRVEISGFPYGISEAEILGIFKAYYPVKCRIMINGPSSTGKQLSYAYVYLPNAELADAAEMDLHLTIYRNHVMEVKRLIL